MMNTCQKCETLQTLLSAYLPTCPTCVGYDRREKMTGLQRAHPETCDLGADLVVNVQRICRLQQRCHVIRACVAGMSG